MHHLRIRGRLIMGFSIVLAFLLISTLVALTALKFSNIHLHDLIDHPVTAERSIKNCRIEANEAARTIREMALNPDKSTYPDYRATVDDKKKEIQASLKELRQAYTENDGLVDRYESAINDWLEIGSAIMDKIENGDLKEAEDMLFKDCVPALDTMLEQGREINAKVSGMEEKSIAANLSNVNNSSIILLFSVVLAILIGIVLAVRITKSIARPVDEIKEAAAEMAKGNLKSEITYSGKDEVGRLADSMRSSMESLSAYILDIDQCMGKMASNDFDTELTQEFVGDFKNIKDSTESFLNKISATLREIEQISTQVATGSEQIALGAETLSEGASEQSNSVEVLTETINRISTQVHNNADYASEASEKANYVGQELESSNRKMQEMMAAMDEISDSSKEIGKIIKTIEDIAFQTNILALNAAVEAARAGAAGKGFAVVADEVRNLASKSAEASNSTTSLIENSLRAIENGVGIADDTARSLVEVVDGARDITTTIRKISDASKIQADSIVHVTEGMEQISDVVHKNSATAEESAAASEELSSHAQLLKEAISHFRIKR